MATETMILVNPRAREGEVGRRWPDLERQLLGALGEGSARVEFTSAVDYGSGAVRKALKAGIGRILVVGGDGTVSEAVQGFFEGGLPVAPQASLMVMPAGRGDDFFKAIVGRRCLSSADAWKRGLEILKHGKPEPVDLGRIEWLPRQSGANPDVMGRIFVNIASFGFPGLVVNRVLNHAGFWGKGRVGKSGMAYLFQSVAGLLDYQPVITQVTVDGEGIFEGPLFCGFVMNGYYNAGGVRWSDEARIDDGIFHVLVSKPRDVLASALSGPRLLSGDWRNAKGITLAKGKRIEVRVIEGVRRDYPLFEIDGDQPERPGCQGAVIEIMPGAVQLWR